MTKIYNMQDKNSARSLSKMDYLSLRRADPLRIYELVCLFEMI